MNITSNGCTKSLAFAETWWNKKYIHDENMSPHITTYSLGEMSIGDTCKTTNYVMHIMAASITSYDNCWPVGYLPECPSGTRILADAVALQSLDHLNPLRPRQNGRCFPEDTSKCFFLNENVLISIKISLKFVLKGPINNIPALVRIMARCQPGAKPLSESMMFILPTHICVTRPQWVKFYGTILAHRFLVVCIHQSKA